MRVAGLALAGVFAIIVPIAAHADGPKLKLRPADREAMSNSVPVWDSGGSGGHSGAIGAQRAPGRAPQWNGGAGSAHWRQNRQYDTWGFYGGPVPTYWVWVPGSAVFDYPFADWRGPTGGWGKLGQNGSAFLRLSAAPLVWQRRWERAAG
jgi:hypothetical protein